MLRLATIPLALILLLVVSMVWSGSATSQRADFTFVTAQDINTLDPNQMSYLQDMRLAYSIWEGLYAFDGMTLKPVPGVASSTEISPDKRIYTFHLRRDARWSNGDPVTTHDFLFEWRRMLESPGEYSYLFYYIRGAQAYLTKFQDYLQDPAAHARPDFSTVGIKALDDRTLRVTLNDPVPFMLDLMAFPPFMPLNEKSMEPFKQVDSATGHVTYNGRFTRPGLVGNGAFNLVQWDFKRRVRLEQNPMYWDRAHVRSKSIEMLVVADPLGQFLRYESGDIDWVPDPPSEVSPELLKEHRPDLKNFPGFGSWFLSCMVRPEFNDGKPNPLADLNVRKALLMAIDKEPIVKNITRMGEQPATTYIPPNIFPGFVVKPGYPYDPVKARELLAKTPYKDTLPGVTMLCDNATPASSELVQNVSNQWKTNLGLNIPLEAVETKVRRERVNNKDFAISIGDWIGDYPDPSTFTDKYRSNSANNDSGWVSLKYDALLDQATKEIDPKKRYRLLEQADEILETEIPILPLYDITNQYLFRDNVHGLNLNPRNMEMLKGVYVDRGTR